MKHKLLKLQGTNESEFARGVPVEMTMKELGEIPFKITEDKFNNTGFVFGEVEGNYRNNKNMINRTTFTDDLDNVPHDIFDELVEGLKAQGINAVVHTSHNHKVEGKGNRYRVIAETSKTMKPDDYPNAITNFNDDVPVLKKYAKYIDPCTDRKSQYFLAPSHPPGMEEFARKEYINGGQPYIPDTLKRITKDIPSSKVESAKTSMKDILKGVSEGNRHNECARVTGTMFNKGMVYEEVLQIVSGWNQLNKPPLPQEEVDRVVQDLKFTNNFATEELTEPSEPRYQLLHTQDARTSRPQVKWLVDRIFKEKGICTIYAPKSEGKTFLAIDLAYKLALGQDWFGHKVLGARDVVYFAMEDWDGVNIRQQGYELHHQLKSLPNLYVVDDDEFQLDNPSMVRDFMESLKSVNIVNPVIIFDTWQDMTTYLKGNDNDDMSLAINMLKKIVKEFNALIIFLGHTGKDVSKGFRGASSIEGHLDTAIISSYGSWQLGKVKNGSMDLAYEFSYETVDGLGADADEDTLVISPMYKQSSGKSPHRDRQGNQAQLYDLIKVALDKSIYVGKVLENGVACTKCISYEDGEKLIAKVKKKDGKPIDSFRQKTEFKRILETLSGRRDLDKGMSEDGQEYIYYPIL